MKQKMLIISFALMTLMIYSCKKDHDTDPNTPTPNETYPNYSHLSIGNYWIYQQFDIDTNGIATPKNVFDSCYIEKDTIIRGITYYKMVKPEPYNINQFDISFQRDSLHYIINSNGEILFSSLDFTSILKTDCTIGLPGDTIFKYERQMTDKNLSVSTPAGVFVTLNAKETYHMFPNWSTGGSERYLNKRYAKNIGVVIETRPFYSSIPTYIERRLLRYNFAIIN